VRHRVRAAQRGEDHGPGYNFRRKIT
jgi:hypothetical protein